MGMGESFLGGGSDLAGEVVRRWGSGSEPDLRGLLGAVPREREEVWSSALVADAECRAERGLRPTLGHYLELFPWLEPGSRMVQELLAVEVSAPGESVGPDAAGLAARYGERFRDDIALVLELRGGLEGGPGRPEPRPGQRLSKYELRNELGRGSFGQVWLAWDHELACFIALKLIAPTGNLERRLDSLMTEARAASGLNHPNVVGVRAAGRFEAPDDWLYIDMQVCGDAAPTAEEPKAVAAGESLPQRVKQHGPGLAEMARLMAEVCRGVVAAHAQGVVHCDLKPQNVLVTPSGRAMVADFGLSGSGFKAAVDAEQAGVDAGVSQAVRTRSGHTIRGTPAYMSPEQARGESPKPISDVYGLGAILFWLLAGHDPYQLAPGESIEHLLGRLGDTGQAGPPLPREAHPTLARICRRAMEKDPGERYQSAAAMQADLEAFLGRRVPPTVGPESKLQPLSLWARRNALPVSIAAAAVIGLAALSGVALQQARRADERADQLKQVSDFQEKMLAQVDATTAGVRLTEDVNRRFAAALEKLGVPEEDRTQRADAFRQEWLRVNATDAALALIDTTILAPAVKAVNEQFKDQPAVAAQLQQALASCYRELGLYDKAMPLQEAALETRRRVLGEEHPDTLTSLNSIGPLLSAQGKTNDAEQFCRDAMERNLRVLGADDASTLISMSNLGLLLESQRKFGEADSYLRGALDTARRVLGNNNEKTITSINNMGLLMLSMRKLGDAEMYCSDALERARRVFGPKHPSTLKILGNLGNVYISQGKFAQAFECYDEAATTSRIVLGEEHPTTLTLLNNLGALLHTQGRLAESVPYFREAAEKRQRVLGEEHVDTLRSINNLAAALSGLDRPEEAEPYLRKSLHISRRVNGDEDNVTIASMSNLATALVKQRKFDEAEPYAHEAMEASRHAFGYEHPNTLIVTMRMGELLRITGRFGAAIDLLATEEPAARKALSGGNRSWLGSFLLNLGRARLSLGFAAGQFAAAEANLLEAHSILDSTSDRTDKETLMCVEAVAQLYETWDSAEPGREFDTKAKHWQHILADIREPVDVEPTSGETPTAPSK